MHFPCPWPGFISSILFSAQLPDHLHCASHCLLADACSDFSFELGAGRCGMGRVEPALADEAGDDGETLQAGERERERGRKEDNKKASRMCYLSSYGGGHAITTAFLTNTQDPPTAPTAAPTIARPLATSAPRAPSPLR